MLRRLRVAGLTALFALSIFPHAQTPATATSRGSGQIAGHEVTLWDPTRSGGALSLPDGADIVSVDSVDSGTTGPATLLTSGAGGETVCLVAVRPEGSSAFGRTIRELAEAGMVTRVEAEPHL